MIHSVTSFKRLKWFVDFGNLNLVELKDGEWDKLKRDLFRQVFSDERATRSQDFIRFTQRTDIANARSDVKRTLKAIAQWNNSQRPLDPRAYSSQETYQRDLAQRADAREPFYIELELGNQKVWVIRA